MARTYKPRKPATLALNVQIEFEPNRLAQFYLQQVYAQLVPIHARRSSISRAIPRGSVPKPLSLEFSSSPQAKVGGKAL